MENRKHPYLQITPHVKMLCHVQSRLVKKLMEAPVLGLHPEPRKLLLTQTTALIPANGWFRKNSLHEKINKDKKEPKQDPLKNTARTRRK